MATTAPSVPPQPPSLVKSSASPPHPQPTVPARAPQRDDLRQAVAPRARHDEADHPGDARRAREQSAAASPPPTRAARPPMPARARSASGRPSRGPPAFPTLAVGRSPARAPTVPQGQAAGAPRPVEAATVARPAVRPEPRRGRAAAAGRRARGERPQQPVPGRRGRPTCRRAGSGRRRRWVVALAVFGFVLVAAVVVVPRLFDGTPAFELVGTVAVGGGPAGIEPVPRREPRLRDEPQRRHRLGDRHHDPARARRATAGRRRARTR